MNTEHKKGFTLIEMVVSIFIIVIAVVGILQVTSKYVQKTKFEKEAYVAALLGQEAIEIVKNIRDTNWLEGEVWDNELTSCSTTCTIAQLNETYNSPESRLTNCSGGCEIDVTFNASTPSFTPWASGGRYLYIENTSNTYKYIASPVSEDTKSPYKRRIIMTVEGDKVNIIVDLFWRTYSSAIKQDIYDWKQ